MDFNLLSKLSNTELKNLKQFNISKPNKKDVVIDCSCDNICFNQSILNFIFNKLSDFPKDYKIKCHVDKIISEEIFSFLTKNSINYEVIDITNISSDRDFFDIFSETAFIFCKSMTYEIIANVIDIPCVSLKC